MPAAAGASLLAFWARTELGAVLMLVPTAALAFGPGLLPAYLVARRLRLCVPEMLAVAFAVSFALVGISAYAAWMLHLSLSAAIGIYALTAVAAVARGWRHRLDGDGLRRSLACELLAAGVGLLALVEGVWMGFHSDTFYHLAAVRSLLAHDAPLVTDPFYGTAIRSLDPVSGIWHTALAMWSKVSGLDVVAFWAPLAAIAAALFAVGFFRLVREITEDETAAWRATLVLAVIFVFADFRKFAFPNLGSLCLIFLAMAFFVRLARKPESAAFLVATSAMFAATLIHLATAEILYVFVAALVAFSLFGVWWARREGAKAPDYVPAKASWRGPGAVALAAGVVVLATAPSIIERSRVALGGSLFAPGSFDIGGSYVTLARSVLFARIAFPGAPRVLLTYGAIGLGLLSLGMLAVVLIQALKSREARDWGGVAAGSLSFLLLQFPPFTAVAVARFPYMLYRLGALTTYVRPLLAGWLICGKCFWRRARVLGATVMTLSVLLALPATLEGWVGLRASGQVSRPSIAESWAGDIRFLWGEKTIGDFRHLVGRAYPRVASDIVTGYYLAGLAPVSTVAVSDTHSPWALERTEGAARRADMRELLDPRTTQQRRSAILGSYQARYLAVSSDTPQRELVLASLDAEPRLVTRVISSGDLVVFAVNPSPDLPGR
jgi:hypothetical protein